MGTQVIVQRISDISDTVVDDESQLARLIIEHPAYDEPITLEVLPDEVEGELPEEQEAVIVTYFFPGETQGLKYALTAEQLDTLFHGRPVDEVLDRVYTAQKEEQRRQKEPQKRGRGKRAAAETPRPRVDYSSAAHAGEPHRGTVSEGEKEFVRKNLDEVNRRLREQGKREIDPNDPRMASRYGFPPPV